MAVLPKVRASIVVALVAIAATSSDAFSLSNMPSTIHATSSGAFSLSKKPSNIHHAAGRSLFPQPLKQQSFQPLKESTSAALEANGGNTGGGTASMSNEIFNLIKNIVGAGVLSLPAGVAAFGNAPSAMLPAAFMIAAIGGISGYCFSLIGRVCAMTGAKTYREAWGKTVGESTSIVPASCVTFKTLCAILAYSMILADTFAALLGPFVSGITRTKALWGVTGTVLLPLCLLKDLSSLAPFSLLGIIGMVYTGMAMTVRYVGGGYKFPVGEFLGGVSQNMQPSFGNIGARGVLNPKSFILICMLSTAYMSHFNAPKFYVELKDNTIKRYNTVVGTSFAASIAIFIAITSMGFLTFGANSSGLILNNYSLGDKVMGFSRIAVAVSIVFS
jgi:amino acid permease